MTLDRIGVAWEYANGPTYRRIAFRFAPEAEPEAVERVRAQMHKLARYTRERAPKLEANGARVLEAERKKQPVYPWTVRLYYESMGGEILAAEFGGLTEPEARTIAVGRDADVWGGRPKRTERCPGPPKDWPVAPQLANKPCTSERWCLCDGHGYVFPDPPHVRRDARIVVFPSEQRNKVERVDV